MEQSIIIEHIQNSTREVFSMMMGLEVTPETPHEERPGVESFEGVVSLVGIAGPWVGVGTLYCSATLAMQIAGAMLGEQPQSVTDGVLDTMAELANMIIGNVKTLVEVELGPLQLGIPTVIYGRNYKAWNGGGKSRIVVPFTISGQKLLVKFYLAPQDESNSSRHSGMMHTLA